MKKRLDCLSFIWTCHVIFIFISHLPPSFPPSLPLTATYVRVDENRIKEVGPDRACAEWLLRCGAFVRWQDRETWTKDYNTLPPAGNRALKIAEVDATDSAVMHIGFPHFRKLSWHG